MKINPEIELKDIDAIIARIGRGQEAVIPVLQAVFQAKFDNTAHAAHLGGMVMGYLWVKWGGAMARWWAHQKRGPDRAGFYGAPEREAEDQDEVNRILDKIHNLGLGSLTLREKLFLQEMSRKRGQGR